MTELLVQQSIYCAREDNRIRSRLMRAFITALSTLIVLYSFAGASLLADDAKSLRKLHDQVSESYDKSKGIAVAVLSDLKNLNQEYADAGGNPIPAKRIAARKQLARIEKLKLYFDGISDGTEKLATDFDSKYSELQSFSAMEYSYRKNIDRQLADVRRYSGYVDKFYNRAVLTYGSPIRADGQMHAAMIPGGKVYTGLNVNGELNASLGGASYKRPNASPSVDYSSAEFGLRLNGGMTPTPTTNLSFQFGRRNTVQQRKIALTNIGAGLLQAAGDNVDLSFKLNYNHYSDKNDRRFSYGDFSVGSGALYNGSKVSAGVTIDYLSRSYGNNEPANYGVFKFRPTMTAQVGKGSVSTGFQLLSKSNEIELLDHKEFSPFLKWELTRGGSALDIQYQVFSHPNVDDSPQDNKRLKVGFKWNKRSAFGTKRFGPELLVYKYPNQDREDYTDLAFGYEHRGSSNKSFMNSLRLVYRAYAYRPYFDFAQLTYRISKSPIGAGFGWQISLAGRYYTESSDKDDPLRFASVHDPHTVDYYHEMMWIKRLSGTIKSISFGPLWGAKFYFDTERDDAFANDIDYVWENPRNTATWGLRFRTSIQPSPVFGISSGLKYQNNILYNATPSRSYSTFTFDMRGTYNISPRLVVDGRMNFHFTRASIDSDTDLDKIQVVLALQYLFNFAKK